ncbi:MAG: NAD-dependent epimerase/dehydratase family protein [Candidatus Gastranaerophilaceae bacterium]
MNNQKVLLTGVTGLVGKEVIEPLKQMGYQISALTIDENNPDNSVNWIKCNLFDEESLKLAIEKVKPTHLLNFAWATTGNYLTSEINFEFVKSGLNLLKYFKQNGGKRAVFVGTCFEYEFKNEPLKETDTINPQTLYAKSKNALHELAEEYCRINDISFGYGRIFYVYGHGENEKRLTAHLIKTLSNNGEVIINNGDLVKDYMYTKDIAGAFAAFLNSDVKGSVNICTGKGISLRDYSTYIAKQLGKEEYLKINYEETNQPPIIVGDNTRLTKEVGYEIKYSFEKAIEEILK